MSLALLLLVNKHASQDPQLPLKPADERCPWKWTKPVAGPADPGNVQGWLTVPSIPARKAYLACQVSNFCEDTLRSVGGPVLPRLFDPDSCHGPVRYRERGR